MCGRGAYADRHSALNGEIVGANPAMPTAGKVSLTIHCSSGQEEGPDSGFNRCVENTPKRKRMGGRIETNIVRGLTYSFECALDGAGTYCGHLTTARLKVWSLSELPTLK